MSNETEFYEIKAVEIFEEGTWNGDSYSQDDLDKIVMAFSETKDNLKPYLKLGHNESQKILENDGLPAAGWISNVYREGKKLLADFSNVPKKIYELIKRKAYRRVSSEIFVNIPVGGKEYPYALKAVALLGGDTPAVNSLSDILGLFTAPNFTKSFDKEAIFRRYDFDNPLLEIKKEEINNMELEKAVAEIEALKAEIVAKEESMKQFELKANETKEFAEKVQSENELLKKEKRSVAISLKVDKFIQDGKITPAQGNILTALLAETDTTKKFKIGEKEIDGTESLICEFIEAGSKEKLNTAGTSEEGKQQNTDIDTLVKEFMVKNNVSYKEALIKLASEKK